MTNRNLDKKSYNYKQGYKNGKDYWRNQYRVKMNNYDDGIRKKMNIFLGVAKITILILFVLLIVSVSLNFYLLKLL